MYLGRWKQWEVSSTGITTLAVTTPHLRAKRADPCMVGVPLAGTLGWRGTGLTPARPHRGVARGPLEGGTGLTPARPRPPAGPWRGLLLWLAYNLGVIMGGLARYIRLLADSTAMMLLEQVVLQILV